MDLRKEINLNKKFILILVLINVIVLGLYYSYALFETKVIKDNVVVIKTATINITTEVSGYENNRITLLSGESKTLTINLESNYTSPNAYKLYYKLISGEANIKSTSITTVGEINENLSITCIIENRGEVDTTIEIGTKGGLIGYEIELDDDCYEFNKVVNVTFDYQDNVTESATRKVVVGEEYGELPTPNEREGYTFIGWYDEAYSTYKYLRLFQDALCNNVLRLSFDNMFSDNTFQLFEENDIIYFDISILDTKFVSVDIADIEVDDSLYDNKSNRIIGEINITKNMTIKKNNDYYYNFIDFNLETLSNNYTINKFSLIKYNSPTVNTTIVTRNVDHTLKAIWKENE